MTIKTVYQLDPDGLYLGLATAHESPLELGVFNLPAGCVELTPPPAQIGEVAVWSCGEWYLAEDHRGETWYLNGDRAVIEFVGDPSLRGYSALPAAPSLDDLRTDKISSITAISATLLAAGAPVDAGLHIALDDSSRADLAAMAATATVALSGVVPWPESYARGWITVENVRVPLPTPTDGLALFAVVGNYYAALVQHRRDLKDAALQAEDEASLAAIDVGTGWPAS